MNKIEKALKINQRIAETRVQSAIEHGIYLANAAEMFIESVNKLDSIISDDICIFSEHEIHDAENDRSESWDYLKTAIHEFRKRADRVRQ